MDCGVASKNRRCSKCDPYKPKVAIGAKGKPFPRVQKLFNDLCARVRSAQQGRNKSSARSVTLTLAEFVAIRSQPCHYCGGALPPHGSGLDRIDSQRGYDTGNVLPACWRCNVARGALLTVKELEVVMAARRLRLGPDADLWGEFAHVAPIGRRSGVERGSNGDAL